MNSILANDSISIMSLKKYSSSEAIPMLNRNKASAYLVPSQTYERLMAIVDDYLFPKEIDKRMNDGSQHIEVNIDEFIILNSTKKL